MPKLAKELSAVEVRRLDKPGIHAVGGVAGLQLNVKKTGAKSWILRAKIGSKRRDIGLGGFPSVTLQQARDKARNTREKIEQGVDPILERQALKDNLAAAQAKRITFDEALKKYHASKSHEFRNRKHSSNWINSVTTYACPLIGSMPVANIEIEHVIKVLDPIWHTKTETASRVRQRIEAVLTWATVRGYRSGDNPARWAGNLKVELPAPNKLKKVKHHKALPFKAVGAFMADLREREGMGARALEFAILTAARSGDVRGAVWDEIDLDSKRWTIPAERMKAEREHVVPLSEAAIQLLNSVPRLGEQVFQAPRGGVLSDMSLSAVTRRMKAECVPHGFRSSFKDWARNSTRYPDELSELALAHVNSDETRAAYARDMLIEPRRRLMDDWAKYCGMVQSSGDVVDIGGTRV